MGVEDKGLLGLWLSMDARHEGALDAWYDTEHTDLVLEVPAVLGSRRFKARHMDEGEALNYLIVYETVDETVQPSPVYQAVADHPTPWARYMRTLYAMLRRINYKLLQRRRAENAGAEQAVLLIRSLRRGDANDLAGWSDQVARAALQVPGCRGADLYQAMPNKHGLPGGEQGTSPLEVLELYSFSAADADQSPAWREFLVARKAACADALTEIQRRAYVTVTAPRRKA